MRLLSDLRYPIHSFILIEHLYRAPQENYSEALNMVSKAYHGLSSKYLYDLVRKPASAPS